MPTTADPALDAMALTADDFAEAFGGAMAYHPTGGRCARKRCTEDAPFVKIGRKTVKLPCPAHAAEDAAREQAEENAARAVEYLLQSGQTARLSAWSLDTYATECADDEGLAALALAQRWLKTYRDTGTARNIIMWGPIGTGKTGLAWAMVRSLCENGKRAKIVNFRHLLEEMKDCYARHIPTTHALECHRVPVLALDDLGAERPTEWACGELLGIVDHRYEAGLPTIYVSNYAPADLIRRLGKDDPIIGQRIVSRMYERAEKFEFKGDDRRRVAA